MVQAVPPNSPPVVTILTPHNGATFYVDTPGTIPLQGTVNTEAGAVTYRWTVISEGKEKEIGSGPSLNWNPLHDVPPPCPPLGTGKIVVKLYATNANGTSSATVAIQLLSNLC
jgi:hypothetical protein